MLKKLYLLTTLLVLCIGFAQAQTTIMSRIASDEDDAEEYIGTPNNDSFRPDGSMDLGSSDIELGAEKQGGINPQISGLRFTGLDIPQGAYILSAKIEFTVDATDKNEDPASFYIHAEDNATPSVFTSTDYNITSRTWLQDSVKWELESGSWATVGEVEYSTDISSLVQQLVDASGWTNNNAMAFFIKGTGVREAESFSDADNAPQLVITYIPETSIVSQIADDADDAEEYIGTPNNDSFRPDGSMDLASSDIELGAEKQGGVNPQISGLRFTNLDIPKFAKIQSAYIEFTVDATNKNEDPASFYIHAENNATPSSFTETDYDITSRTWVEDSVKWELESGSWANVADKEHTTDISELVQSLVNKDDWSNGNAMAFFIKGSGVREAESFSDADNAARLIINYIPVSSEGYAIASSSDDAEEYIGTPNNDSFRPDGSMDLASSDIEIGAEKQSGINPQISGLRFTNISLPNSAVIESAHIKFTVDATNKNEDPASFYIYIEDNTTPSTFTETDYDLTTRTWLKDSVKWELESGSWNTVGNEEVTADISSLVQALVNKNEWTTGNSLAIFIKGTGVREAESFDGSDTPAELIIEYLQGEIIYKPELVREIEDQELVQNWDFSLDISTYFRDNDSELSFEAYESGQTTLPDWLSFDNGILSGTNTNIESTNITVKALSDGDSIMDEFVIDYIAPSGDFTLAIFHNNDGESHLLGDSVVIKDEKVRVASISQFKSTLDSMRNQASTRGYETMMLSSGDNFLAGLEYNASTSNGVYYDAIAIDSLKYDAIDLGNHDFDFGTQVLSEFITAIDVNQTPYLTSNLGFENVPELQALVDNGRIKNYTIVNKGGQDIGVIGLTTPLLPIISSPGNTIVSEAIIDSVTKYVDELTTMGVNKIILISHLQGLDEDIDLIKDISGIDVIIAGGGDELLANNPDLGAPFSISPYDSYPIVAKDKDDKDVYIVTTPGGYRFLGNLIIDFNSAGEVTKLYHSDPILVQGASNTDMVTQVEEPIRNYIGALATTVIANVEDTLDFLRESLRFEESNGGNLFADALLYQAKKTHASFGLNAPDIAIQNSGGLRLESLVGEGDFTEDLTYKIAAFTNILSMVEDISPEKLVELIEHGIGQSPDLDGRFPQIAGFKIVFDPSKEEGSKVKSITLDDGTKIVEDGAIVSGAPNVNLATIDFTANGGDGYPFSPLTYSTMGATYQQAFYNYLTEVDGLNGVVTEAMYPYGMNERIFVEIDEVQAISAYLIDEDFNDCENGFPSDWTSYSVTSDQNWECSDDTRGASGESGDYAAEMNGYGADVASDDWLISPQVTMTGEDYILNFKSMSKYSGPAIKVVYSTDYDGSSAPSTATWTTFTVAQNAAASGDSWTFVESGDLVLEGFEGDYHFAFNYTSSGTGGGEALTYRVDDFSLRSTVLASEDFNNNCTLEDWTIYETDTEGLVTCSSEGFEDATDDYSIKFNGYQVGAGEGWVISPKLAFSDFDYVINFASKEQYSGPDLEIVYSTDYVGVGNPNDATWTNITAAEEAVTGSFNRSGDIDLSLITEDAYIAFKYTSNGTNGGDSKLTLLDEIFIREPAIITNEGSKKIYEIQGSTDVSPFENGLVEVSGIVTAYFNEVEPYAGAGFNGSIVGFYMQDPEGDNDESTSDGIFVYTTDAVAVGDSVTVEGKVVEYFGLTEITEVDELTIHSSNNTIPTAATVTLPLASPDDFEKYEGMLVTFTQELTVTENYSLGQYGEVMLSSDGILYQPTQIVDVNDADATGVTADGLSNLDAVNTQVAANAANQFVLDDARTGTNLTPTPFVDGNGTLLGGSTVSNLSGVFTYSFSEYKLLPTAAPSFTYKERETAPTFDDATLKVAAFNVLNYFNGDGQGGGFPTSRGAETEAEFAMQSQKIVAALVAMDADVVGLIEIENDEDNGFSAIKALVDSLNDAIGSITYAFVETGKVYSADGTADEIKNGFIYKTATVSLVGEDTVISNDYDANYVDTKNRPAIAQTFMEIASGEEFTAVINHLKSKGSDCDDLGDPNMSDGQGNCNGTRTSAAGTLAEWLSTNPTGSTSDNILILGDLNAYAQEDPIDTLRSLDYEVLTEDTDYSYVYEGQYGTLDYAIANATLAQKVTSTKIWHINSDEPTMLAYYNVGDDFTADAYRSSDHDPVIVGLKLDNTTTGIDEDIINNNIAYPNPSQGVVYFKTAVSGVIYNNLGVLVAQLDASTKVDLSVVGKGVYTFKSTTGFITKLVIQ